VHPQAAVSDLDAAALARVFRQTRRVLRIAVDKGAGAEEVDRRVPRTWLLPHGRGGARCPRCGGRVETLTVIGRTAYLCPRCQPR
jgi:formamidopyrimidine-DNA glycosylase